MKLLENYSTPVQMLSVDSQTLAELLSRAILASSSFSLIIKQYIEQLKNFESCTEIFDAEIAKIYDTFDCQIHTITDIGKTLAVVILSEIGGDITKFDSVPKLIAFAGLYPKNRQSGESINSKFRLSKSGSPYLRRAILHASFVAAFKDPSIHQFYERKRSEGKDHLNVMGHVCHKLISIIFAVLRDNKPYIPHQISS